MASTVMYDMLTIVQSLPSLMSLTDQFQFDNHPLVLRKYYYVANDALKILQGHHQICWIIITLLHHKRMLASLLLNPEYVKTIPVSFVRCVGPCPHPLPIIKRMVIGTDTA